MARTKPPKKQIDKIFNGPFPLQDDEIFLSLSIGRQNFVYNIFLQPISGWSNGKCYSKAFGHEKIKPSHYVESSRLLKAPKILYCIRQLKKQRVRNLELTKERILEEEACLAYSNIAELFDDQGETRVNPKDLPESIQRAIAGIEIKFDSFGRKVYKYKLWDKGKSLDRLQSVKGMKAPQKHLLGSDPDNPLPDPGQHQEQLLSLLLRLAERTPEQIQGMSVTNQEGVEDDEWSDCFHLSDPAGVLRACNYNDEIETLTLIFEDGKVVEYLDFPEHLYDSLIDAKNPSAFYSRRIDGNYTYNMISEKDNGSGRPD